MFDATDEAALAARGVAPGTLAAPGWEDETRGGRASRTQRFAMRLVAEGVRALKVPSYAPGARDGETNLVLFRWGVGPGATLRLVGGTAGAPSRPASGPALRPARRGRP